MRHYDDIGLLVPSCVDPHTGYRDYDGGDLQRGVRIEQLKAAGFDLATAREILDGDVPVDEALNRQRARVAAELSDARRRLATVDGLLRVPATLRPPTVVDVPMVAGDVVRDTGAADELAITIRRCVQRARRRAAHAGVFAAEFPLDVDDGPVDVAVWAEVPDSTPAAPRRAVAIEMVGPLALLPLAYDAALVEVDRLGLMPTGSVVERYHDLTATPHVELSVLVAAPLG